MIANTIRDTAILIGVFIDFSIAIAVLAIGVDAVANWSSGQRITDPDWWLVPIFAAVVPVPAFVTSYAGYVFDRLLSNSGAGYIWYSCAGSVGPVLLLMFFDWADESYFTPPGLNLQYGAIGVVIGATYGCLVRLAIWR